MRRARDHAALAVAALLDSPEGAEVFDRLSAHQIGRNDAVDALLAMLGGPVHAY